MKKPKPRKASGARRVGRPEKAPTWPADKISRRPVAELIPYARNARTHSDAQVAQIAGSIREWGWTIPVLVDPEGTIIAGHGRVLAAHLLKLRDVPTMVAEGWTPAQVAAYRLADNQLGLNAGWDEQLLGLELVDVRELGGLDLGLMGFSADEIERLIAGPSPPGQFPEHGENIATAHQCPKCGFRWSGGSTAIENGADET